MRKFRSITILHRYHTRPTGGTSQAQGHKQPQGHQGEKAAPPNPFFRKWQAFHFGAALARRGSSGFPWQWPDRRPGEKPKRTGESSTGISARIRWVMSPLSMSAPRAFWAAMILSVSSSKSGNKPQGNGHHHGKLVHRHMELAQRLQKPLNGVGKLGGRRGEGQHRACQNQGHNTNGHKDTGDRCRLK